TFFCYDPERAAISPLSLHDALPICRRASRVQVYGVDDRFWRFHHVDGVSGPSGRDALISRALAADIGAAAGSAVLVRVERPSARSEEHTSELQSRVDLVCRLLLEKK